MARIQVWGGGGWLRRIPLVLGITLGYPLTFVKVRGRGLWHVSCGDSLGTACAKPNRRLPLAILEVDGARNEVDRRQHDKRSRSARAQKSAKKFVAKRPALKWPAAAAQVHGGH